jgi:CHAT domain-containing protein
MEEKVLEFTTHNEFLIKERQQSKVIFFELKKKNSQLDANLKQKEPARVETK